MTKKNQWMRKRVTFVLSDDVHKLHFATMWGQVRVQSHDPSSGAFIYEGPLLDMWNVLKVWYPTTVENRTLVGIIYASEAEVDRGAIGWLKADSPEQEINETL